MDLFSIRNKWICSTEYRPLDGYIRKRDQLEQVTGIMEIQPKIGAPEESVSGMEVQREIVALDGSVSGKNWKRKFNVQHPTKSKIPRIYSESSQVTGIKIQPKIIAPEELVSGMEVQREIVALDGSVSGKNLKRKFNVQHPTKSKKPRRFSESSQSSYDDR